MSLADSLLNASKVRGVFLYVMLKHVSNRLQEFLLFSRKTFWLEVPVSM